jgi:2-oxoglutarate ferredoxin oxidoreductase subunit gamma
MRSEIRFAGVGGQGNIQAGEWLALAAHNMGKHAVQSPTYTAQVRGGPTSVDVLFDEDEIIYPRLTAIDFFMCLAQGAWDVFSHQLKPESIVVIAPDLVRRVGPGPQMIYRVPIISITKQVTGKMVYTSTVALGIYCRLMERIPKEVMMKTIEDHAPSGTVEANFKAFHAGWNSIDNVKPEPRDQVHAEQMAEAAQAV